MFRSVPVEMCYRSSYSFLKSISLRAGMCRTSLHNRMSSLIPFFFFFWRWATTLVTLHLVISALGVPQTVCVCVCLCAHQPCLSTCPVSDSAPRGRHRTPWYWAMTQPQPVITTSANTRSSWKCPLCCSNAAMTEATDIKWSERCAAGGEHLQHVWHCDFGGFSSFTSLPT